jgi:hypothetical protein
MGAKITRRDFLNGVALTAGAAIVPAIIPPEMWAAAAADLQSEAQDAPGYYPPGKTGLRGDHAVRSKPCTNSATALSGTTLPRPWIQANPTIW